MESLPHPSLNLTYIRTFSISECAYSHEAAGDTAVEGLNNTQVDGRTIRVNKAHPREKRPAPAHQAYS